MSDFDKKIAAAREDTTLSKLRIDRRQLAHYATFPFAAAAQRILSGLGR
jgi:hypothetical protein